MGRNIVLLHGWGQNAPDKLEVLASELNKSGFKSRVFRLPGFGSSEPSDTWGVEEYGNWVIEKLKKEKIKLPILFGYSFGGQIAAFIAANQLYPLSSLVLCASGAIRKPASMHKQIIKFFSNIKVLAPFKLLFRKVYINMYPNSDYHNSSGTMQKILTRVINQDLSNLLPKIKVPTLIIWGENDRTLPLSLGRETLALIKNSKLITLSDATHSIPYSHPKNIAEIINNFTK